MVKIDSVWDSSVAFLRDHLSSVLPFALAGLLVPNAFLSVLTPLWANPDMGVRLGLFIATVAVVLVMLWASLAITIKAIDPLDRGATSALAVRRLGPMAGVYLVLALIFSLLVVPFSILSVVAGIDPSAMQTGGQMRILSPGAGWGLIVYLLLFLVFTLVAVARLMPLTAVVAAERRGVRAIARTWRLTRGITWRLIAVTILYYIVSIVAGLAAKTVFGTIFSLFGSNQGTVTVPGVLTAIVAAIVSAGFTTLAAVFAAKLYVALAANADVTGEHPSIATSS